MFVISNLLLALAQILSIVLTVVYWLVLIRAIISWVNPDPYNAIVQFLYKTTEPLLYPIRRLLPVQFRMGIDISPLILFILIMFVKNFAVKTLVDLAYNLR